MGKHLSSKATAPAITCAGVCPGTRPGRANCLAPAFISCPGSSLKLLHGFRFWKFEETLTKKVQDEKETIFDVKRLAETSNHLLRYTVWCYAVTRMTIATSLANLIETPFNLKLKTTCTNLSDNPSTTVLGVKSLEVAPNCLIPETLKHSNCTCEISWKLKPSSGQHVLLGKCKWLWKRVRRKLLKRNIHSGLSTSIIIYLLFHVD